ncbi:unnamed protein product, partial [Prorocentrum cordatum]
QRRRRARAGQAARPRQGQLARHGRRAQVEQRGAGGLRQGLQGGQPRSQQ